MKKIILLGCLLLSLLLVLLVGHLGYLRAMRLYMSKP